MTQTAQEKMPILPLVNSVYAVISRNPMMMVRAGLFPFLLLLLVGLWTTPPEWGEVAYHAFRSVEWILVLAFWTFYASQMMRFVAKGPFDGAVGFLPKLNKMEARFALGSIIVFVPLTGFAVWYDQPLFFHQPDLLVMGTMTALEGTGELLYVSLFLGWLMQAMAFVLPAIADGDERSVLKLMYMSLDALRQDFSRLFAASLLVVLPVWGFFTILRFVLHTPFFAQLALSSEASALGWNLIFYALETLKTFISGGLLALLWGLTYGRQKGRLNP